MADDEAQATEAVCDNPVMSSTRADLPSCVCLFEFTAIAFKLIWSNKLMSRGLIATKYCSVFRDLYVDGECFKPVSGHAGVDK